MRTPPPGLPIVDFELRSLLHKCEQAAKILHDAGLSVYGAPNSAWHLLEVLGDMVAQSVNAQDAELIYEATQEAWKSLPAKSRVPNPQALKLVGRQRGLIVAVPPSVATGPPILLVDGGDRQIVAAQAERDPNTVTVELPLSSAREIGSLLEAQYPSRVTRASAIQATYECGGVLVAFDPSDPSVEDALGHSIRMVVSLALRYRCSFWRGSIEDGLRRLSLVRYRWLPELAMRLGDQLFPVTGFTDRALLLPSPQGATILVLRLRSRDRGSCSLASPKRWVRRSAVGGQWASL